METSVVPRAPLPPLPPLLPLLGVGERAPDFEIADAAGRAYRLADFRGSPVVLAFEPDGWGGWDPARAEYVGLYNRVIARSPGLAGARLLGIGGGDGAWRELAFADGAIAIPVLSGGGAAPPAVYVLDGEGTVRWRHAAGGALPHPDDLARALAGLLVPPAPETTPPPNEVTPRERGGGGGGSWTRREFVATALGAAVAMALAPLARARAAPAPVAAPPAAPPPRVGDAVPVTLRVNGRELSLTLEPRVTLLDALREYAGLTGSKKGCDHGQCGACTVHVDGRRVLSCLTFAVMQQGKAITTIEGLAPGGDQLHPMQQAFLEHDGFQCGYCTPGQIMSACAVVREPWGPGDDDVREAMSGNICRCGAYPGIVAAVQDVRKAGGVTSDGGSVK